MPPSAPAVTETGTNWNYAHTNYVILGLAMEKITGKPMQQLLAERVLGPLGLHNTSDPGTPAITEPALHAYSSERRYALKIPASVPFTEDGDVPESVRAPRGARSRVGVKGPRRWSVAAGR